MREERKLVLLMVDFVITILLLLVVDFGALTHQIDSIDLLIGILFCVINFFYIGMIHNELSK